MKTSRLNYRVYNNFKIGDVVLTKYIPHGNMCVAIVIDAWFYQYRFIIEGKISERSRFYTSKFIGSDDPITYINIL